jgi:dTDP-4-amino-4,6-dideoxygalactose transaminase
MLDSQVVSAPFLPFALPEIGEEEIAEVVDSLRSGWVTTGPKARTFERDFATFIGGDVEAIAVSSATAGLHLALEAAGIREGDEVITTPYTFTASAEVIRYLGAHPVFVDIDPNTLNIAAEGIEAALTSRTRAILPVHFGGLAAPMAEILDIARRHDLRVVEDAAHAFPSLADGRLVGSLDSDATVFSFYATKTITTGEGGMLVTRDHALAERCRVMRLHGISRDAFDRYVSRTPAWHYDVVAPGYKYNLTDIAAALGIQQLKKAPRFHRRRLELALRYDRAFEGLPLILPPRSEPVESHAFHLYVIRLDGAGIARDAFIAEMAERGIGCSVHFIPLHIHPYWSKQYNLEPSDYPNAYAAYSQAVSLPLYTRMTEADQDRVIGAVRCILER